MHRQHYTDLYREPEEPSDLITAVAAALTAAALASLTLFLFTL
jgi:hypothetical protein